MQWFETVPGTVQASVDAYLTAAAAHERAAEAARQAAVAAQALAVRVPVTGDPADAATGTTATGTTATGTTATGTPAWDTPASGTTATMGATTTSTTTDSAATSAPGTGAVGTGSAGFDATGLGATGLGVAGGGPWPGELLDVLARRLPAGDLALAALSEAELAAATGAQAGQQRLVPFPYLDALPAWSRHAAVAAGLDSLARRGLLTPDGHPGWALAALLAVRTLPRTVTVAGPERQLSSSCHYLYGAGGDVVLEEVVEPTGTHFFTLRSRGSACARLARLADPDGRARASSPPLVAGAAAAAEWTAVHDAIAHAERVTQVSTTRRPPHHPPSGHTPGGAVAEWLLLRLIAGPDGLLALACRHAAGAGQPANARWLSGWALQRLLLACLDVAPVPTHVPAGTR